MPPKYYLHTRKYPNPENFVDFLLSTVIIFCKVTANIELANTGPLLLGKIQDWCPVSLWSQPFVQRSVVHSFVLRVFLFKDTLFDTNCWFIHIVLLASGAVAHT